MASQELSYRLASYSIQSVYSIMLYGKFERLSTIRMARAKYGVVLVTVPVPFKPEQSKIDVTYDSRWRFKYFVLWYYSVHKTRCFAAPS
eukprot:scaffold3075_cov134-Amphora_coffeaeformis.AAC.7